MSLKVKWNLIFRKIWDFKSFTFGGVFFFIVIASLLDIYASNSFIQLRPGVRSFRDTRNEIDNDGAIWQEPLPRKTFSKLPIHDFSIIDWCVLTEIRGEAGFQAVTCGANKNGNRKIYLFEPKYFPFTKDLKFQDFHLLGPYTTSKLPTKEKLLAYSEILSPVSNSSIRTEWDPKKEWFWMKFYYGNEFYSLIGRQIIGSFDNFFSASGTVIVFLLFMLSLAIDTFIFLLKLINRFIRN